MPILKIHSPVSSFNLPLLFQTHSLLPLFFAFYRSSRRLQLSPSSDSARTAEEGFNYTRVSASVTLLRRDPQRIPGEHEAPKEKKVSSESESFPSLLPFPRRVLYRTTKRSRIRRRDGVSSKGRPACTGSHEYSPPCRDRSRNLLIRASVIHKLTTQSIRWLL